MLKGKTKSGFEFEIPKDVFDDMELVDLLVEAKEDNPGAVSNVVKKILGDAQRKKLYNNLRTADGRVPVMKVIESVKEIFDCFGQEGKNS